MSAEPLAVTILGGFLGAGKTTLLQDMLRTMQGRRIAVIVNDFGSLDIDADLVESVHEGVMRLKGGCMCCAMRDSAISTVLALAEQEPVPEYVLIEASGASDVGVLKQTFRELQRHQTVRLDALVTLVDAENFDPKDKKLGLLQRCQVMAADLVLINKIDLVSAERLNAVQAAVSKIAPEARVWVTSQAVVPEALLLGLTPTDSPSGLAAPADTLLETQVLTQFATTPGHELVQKLAQLPKAIYRLKGFVRLAERPQDKVLIQVVAGRVHVRTQGEWLADEACGSLVAIGLKGAVDWSQAQRAVFGERESDG